MDIKNSYWKFLADRKFRLTCLQVIYKQNVTMFRWLKVVISIVSSSALAMWAFWNKHDMLWGLIIVLGQIASTICEQISFSDRINDLSALCSELETLYLDIEKEWYGIYSGCVDDETIFKTRQVFLEKWEKAEGSHLGRDCVGLNNKRLLKKVEEATNAYLDELCGDG